MNKTQKISINIGTNVLENIDKYAEELGVNRSAAITFLCSQYFRSIEAMHTLQNSVEVVNNAKEV